MLLEPDDVAWIDVIVPRGDPLWSDDVAVAAEWLGQVWVAALADLGVAGGVAHHGGLACGALGSVVCFGGTGPGEVLVGGEKVVGISQRRTRAGARFQCSVPLRWWADRHAALLAPGVAAPAPGCRSGRGRRPARRRRRAPAHRGVGGAVLAALVARLP